MRIVLICFIIMSGCLNPLFSQSQKGLASVRPLAHEGTYTKMGIIFSHDSLVASHRTIPFGSQVKVTNLKTMKSVDVIITDRGPFINGRIIDLSEIAGQQIGLGHNSVAEVRIDILNIAKNYSLKDYYTSNTKGNYTIKLGSFGDKENATKFASNLTQNYQIQNITILAEAVNNKTLYKVYVGQFSSRELAEDFLSKLPDVANNAYVTTIKK